MSLVDSLLAAIVRLEGDSLVLHTGEKPYVVTSSSAMNAYRGPVAWGQVELSTRALTPGAVMGLMEQLLDREHLRTLDEMGAVESFLPELPDRPAFQVVAARGGDDIWVEVRPVRAKPEASVQPVVEGPEEAPAAQAPEEGAAARIEVVPEVSQEQPDAEAVAELLASSGLGAQEPARAATPAPAAEESAALVDEQKRLAAAREEAARLEAHAREEAARLESLRAEASQLEQAREEAARAAAAARDEAVRAEAEARAAAEARERAAGDETARLQALRDELATLERSREEAQRGETARLEAVRAEAAKLETARDELSRAQAAARDEAARVEALRQEAARLEDVRAEAARVEAAAREEGARLESLRAESARLEATRTEAERRAALAQDDAQRLEALRHEAAAVETTARGEAARVEALRAEAVRLEAARAEAERAGARAREEAARVEALRQEATRLEAARAEAERVEALTREETARVEALRQEAARLEAARAEAARVEALAREEALRVEALREEAGRLDAVRAEAETVEAVAREESARILALREEAARLEAAREEASRIETLARVESARVETLRGEASRLEAAHAEATRAETEARERAAQLADAALSQSATLETAQREIAALRTAIRLESERLEAARSTVADIEQARLQAEREEQERAAAVREAEERERARLEELRAEAEKAALARREHEAAARAAREEAQAPERVARRAGEERLQALVAALRDESAARAPRTRPAPAPTPPPRAAEPPREQTPDEHAGAPSGATNVPPVRAEDAIPQIQEMPPAEPAARVEEETQGLRGHRVEPPEEVEEVQQQVEPVKTEEPRPAQVVTLMRGVRDTAPPITSQATSAPDLDRLLRIAAARGASGLYLVSRSHPAVRVDGDMQTLEGEAPLAAADVEAFTLGLAPEPSRDSVKSGATVEWFCEVPDIGRVRCLSFRDHRGPGVIIRMLPGRSVSAEQLGLSRDVQALSMQADGLVLVAGPRASGKSTMLAAFVDLINRTRADHVITIERQMTFVHESQRAFVSQREVRGEAHEVLAAVRVALREDPDVLVVEELRSPEVVSAVLESAESGRLVVAGLRAPAAAQAVERLINQVPGDERADALLALSTSLRGVVFQALLRKRSGGRVAARELLLNTPGVAAVLAEGKLFQLGAALESGRKLGSLPLNDTLVSLIRDGFVDPGEAWRKAYDREGLLTLLKREGIDTSFVERFA